ncbi:MAG: transporter, CydDC cysteine exporter (CydDC-E) family, permease/ATP-binding protein CydD [Firmicutes bacterium]|nr:transporter, CydDC cysteine exporter (CydDC-E) family, permease/ATP-binding protein CydD [Bacillota bacterium]
MTTSNPLHAELRKKMLLVCSLAGIGLGGGLAAVVQAKVLADIVDGAFLNGAGIRQLTVPILFFLAAALAKAILLWLGEVSGGSLAVKVKDHLRQRLLKQLFALGPVYTERERSGELIHTLTEGVESLDAYFSRYVPQLAAAALVPPLILAVVFSLDRVVVLIMLFTAPLIPLFMVLIGRWAMNLHRRQWSVLSMLGGHFFDVLQGLTTLKVFNRSKEQVAVITRLSEQFRDSTLRVLKVAFLSAFVLELVSMLSTAVVAVVVALKLFYGGLTFNQAFFILLLAPEYYLPLRMLGTHFHAGLSGRTAAERIFAVLAVADNMPETKNAQPFLRTNRISVAFEQVTFSYRKELPPVLQTISFQIAAGERIALVGPSGAGKSSIVDLLLGFIAVDGGKISINGQDLQATNRTDWLSHVAYVPQFPHLFQGTVGENIRFGLAGGTEKVEEAARQAGAHEFITRLPNGYDTLIGEGGAGLSGGEKQRIAIARAFYRQAPFLILDEAMAALDPYNEEIIKGAILRLMAGKTVLTIAHRLSTASRADRILVLDQGKIVETGSHADLSEKQGLYYRMTAAYRGSA